VTADELLDLVNLRARYAALLRLSMNGRADAKRLQQVLAPYRANSNRGCQVLVQYENGNAACEVALGDAWRVRPDNELLTELSIWLAPENVQISYGNVNAVPAR
jgi:DNA polymerase III subunit alpha